MYVAELYCYPIKSCRGVYLATAPIGPRGIEHDRQFMVIEEHTGRFVAQRGGGESGVGIASLCQVTTDFKFHLPDLVVSAPGMPTFTLPLHGIDGPTRSVRIWRDEVIVVDQGHEAAAWFSEFLSRERPGRYRLVCFQREEKRFSPDKRGELAFADGFPFLVISQSSLADLNRRIRERHDRTERPEVDLPMNRFRPNIVLADAPAYAEDTLDRIRIGAITLSGAKLCERCPITTTSQLTTQRGKEPLTTLATYRRTADGVVFGRNFNHQGAGIIALGDPVEVL